MQDFQLEKHQKKFGERVPSGTAGGAYKRFPGSLAAKRGGQGDRIERKRGKEWNERKWRNKEEGQGIGGVEKEEGDKKRKEGRKGKGRRGRALDECFAELFEA